MERGILFYYNFTMEALHTLSRGSGSNTTVYTSQGCALETFALHVQVILNCAQDSAGTCDGGDDVGVYQYFKKNGIPDFSCMQ